MLLAYVVWPSSSNAQYSDIFDSVQVRLERLIWSDSLSPEEKVWMQSVLDTMNSSRTEIANISLGVYLENLDLSFVPRHNAFEDQLNNKLQMAKMSPDPTLYLLSSIPYTEMANRPPSVHAYSTADDYIVRILLVRIVKQIRQGNTISNKFMDDFVCMLDEQKKLLLQLAQKSPEELISDFEIIGVRPADSKYSGPDFSSALSTYRKGFVAYFKRYYSPNLFDGLSGEAQRIVLNYWIRNTDLIDHNDLSRILHLINSQLAKDYNERTIAFTLLKCRIENCSREDYLNRVMKFSDKELQQRYDQMTRMIMEIENRFRMHPLTYEWTLFPETQMPFTFRPELVITQFISSNEFDIVKYLEENFNPEFYGNRDFLTNRRTLDIRAATQRLGSFEGKIENHLQPGIDVITSRLLDLCIMDCQYCYEEGAWLILGMGRSAIPGLKMEFLSPDKKRVEMASQLLLLMKDEEVVRLLTGLMTTSKDKEILIWTPAYLYMMEKFIINPMANRGINEEESLRIKNEIIEPFFKSYYPVLQNQN